MSTYEWLPQRLVLAPNQVPIRMLIYFIIRYSSFIIRYSATLLHHSIFCCFTSLFIIRNCLGVPIFRQKIGIFVYVEALFFDA